MVLEMLFDPTTIDWVFVIVVNIALFASFYVPFFLRVLKFGEWQRRKIGHIVLHTTLAIFPVFLQNLFDLLICLTIMGVIVIIISFIPQIRFTQRIIEYTTRSGESKKGMSLNAALTATTVFVLLIIFIDQLHIYTGAVLALSLGDGLGEMIGRPFGRIKYKIIEEKSLEGSLSVFIGIFIGLLIGFAANSVFYQIIYWKILVISIVGTIIEALNYKFIDNFTVPTSVALLLFLLF